MSGERRSGAAIPVATACAVGLVLWIAASFVTGKREPWDSPAYWLFAYPIALIACAFIGYRFPERAWLWALVLFESQLVAMWIRGGEPGNLWPIGMALVAVIAAPGMVVAGFAARRSRNAAA